MVPDSADKNQSLFIKVLDLRPLPPPEEGQPPSNLKAFAVVQVGPFKIHACRVVQVPGHRPYVQLPMREGKGGHWYPILACDDIHLANRIRAAILEAWEEYQGPEGEQLGLGLEVER